LTPATSQEPSGRFASRKRISNRRLWSTKEGVGETSGQTAGPVFSIELALAKTGSAEERSFLHRCGYKGPQFHRRLAGWDLVLTCSPTPSFRARALPPGAFPENLETPVPATAWLHASIRCADGYRFAKRHGKSNSANPTVIQQTSAFAISRRARRQTRSDSIHRKA
jgi:hypothetical protein